MSRTESERATALQHLEHFRRRILPGALRRIASWKGIPRALLRDWLDDVLQELAVDCVENARILASLDDRERHARWMRRTEKVIYRHRRGRNEQPLNVEEPAPEAWSLPGPVDVELPPMVALNNGRPNLQRSVRETGLARRDLRRKLDATAAKLGWDPDQQRFWQFRVAEALTGLAADLLQVRGAVHALGSRPPADIARREARLKRLAPRFPVQPATLQVRRALRPWLRRQREPLPSPRVLLQHAVQLRPDAEASWAWLFEACCDEGDARAAVHCLLQLRVRGGTDRAALVLARARLLELRGASTRARNLLRRSANRWPRAGVLRQALEVLEAEAATTTSGPTT